MTKAWRVLLAGKGILVVLVGGIGAILVYFFSTWVTNLLVINLSLAALAFLFLSYRGLRARVIWGEQAASRRTAFAISLVLTGLLVLVVETPTLVERSKTYPDLSSAEVIQELKERAFPLQSVDAGNGFDDLQPLKPILSGKRIIALGEATHGTSEFFRMKHRMVEFLVREMGFQHFGMELSPQDGQLLNAYIHGLDVDPRKVLYWPWATDEVVDMLDWMRDYNADPTSPFQLTFHGIDPRVGQRDASMAANTTQILEQAGQDSKIVLWAHNAHICGAEGAAGDYLKQRWGDQAYLLGFEFDQGSFTSRLMTIFTYRVDPASPAYYAYTLAKLDEPILFLDFAGLSQAPALQAWLAKPQKSHLLQEGHAVLRLNPAWISEQTGWLQLYDGLIYIEESTPAHSVQ